MNQKTRCTIRAVLIATTLVCSACGGSAEVQDSDAPVAGSEAAVTKTVGKFDHSKFNLAVFQ